MLSAPGSADVTPCLRGPEVYFIGSGLALGPRHLPIHVRLLSSASGADSLLSLFSSLATYPLAGFGRGRPDANLVFSLVGDPLALVSFPLPLVSFPLPLVSFPLPLISDAVATVGEPLPPRGSMLAPLDGALPLFELALGAPGVI